MTVSGIDQAGISIIQKSRRELQFSQSKWGAGRKEEALPKIEIHKGRKGGIRVIGALERKEEPYFSRFVLEEKKLAAIKEEKAMREFETRKAKETLLETEYPPLYGKEVLEEKNILKPIESFKEIRKERYRRERRDKEVAKPSGKLDVEGLRCEEEGSRHWKNIDGLLSTFKRTGNLEPEEMLRLLESEKYAVEKKKEDLRREIKFKKINKVEKEYYKDIPPIPRGLKKLLRDKAETLPKEEAEKLLKDFITTVEGLKLGESGERSFVRLLEEMRFTD